MKTERKGILHKNPETAVSAETAVSETIPSAFYVLLRGRVQGVGFRYSAAREAHRLNIKGWVRNTDDGDVEVWAEGSPEKMDIFLSWLRRGPQLARVDSLKKEDTQPGGYSDFSIN